MGAPPPVGDSGILTADASTVTLVDASMTGGTSGTIALTSGASTLSGSWDTSGPGSGFTRGTSTVSLSGAGTTVRIRDFANGFHNLTITGTVTQGSAVDANGTLSIRGTLTTAGNNITGGASLTVSAGGAPAGGTSAVTPPNVTMKDAAAEFPPLSTRGITPSGNVGTSSASSTLTAGGHSLR